MLKNMQEITFLTDTFFKGEMAICHPYFSEYTGGDGKLLIKQYPNQYGPATEKVFTCKPDTHNFDTYGILPASASILKKESIKSLGIKTNSEAGNRTPVVRVTGGNT